MPNKQSGTGRKTTAGKKSSATVRQRAPRALADGGGPTALEGDPPIIVQGGGSGTSTATSDSTDSTDTAAPQGDPPLIVQGGGD